MEQFFTSDYAGPPFEMGNVPHAASLILVLLACILIYALRDRFSPPMKTLARWALAVGLVGNELAYHAWNIHYGLWTFQYNLPLHICSIMVFASAVMLITRSYAIYEFSYFLGIGAAIQALLTPDVGIYGFPHYRFFQTMTAHGLLILCAVYMTAVEKFRPYPKSLLRVAVVMNVYMAVIFVFNQLTGSNYLFIAHKPETASLIDVLGPWPWYILSIEAIGTAICLLLYSPFFFKDLSAGRRKAAAAAQNTA
ncbi:MAG: TIGR02206 family membrane protein [Anaerolineales bacterium]|nr:TIGR02206 family membrane protein [Anaerolineales bacterium]